MLRADVVEEQCLLQLAKLKLVHILSVQCCNHVLTADGSRRIVCCVYCSLVPKIYSDLGC